jgi:hypothetical protein
LALSAGNDLEERDVAGIDRHVAVCPTCREAWQSLRRAQQALEQVSAAPVVEPTTLVCRPTGSVWPSVARHLRSIDAQAAAPDWRGWLPSLALAAACVAVVVVAIPESSFNPETARRRDLRVVAPELFVGETDPATLSRLPIERFRGGEGDFEAGRGDFPLLLPVRDEPRSF